MTKKLAIQLTGTKKVVEIERFSQNGAIGWRIFRPDGSKNYQGMSIVHFDEHCAAFDIFRLAFQRDPTHNDNSIMESIKFHI